jgi:hypothetical protein
MNYILVGALVDLLCYSLIQNKYVILEVFFVYLYYYLYHRFVLHVFDINLHVYVHHYKYFHIPRYLELIIDFLFELFSFGGTLLFLQYYFDTWLIPPSVVSIVVLTLSLSHLFNYSLLGSEIHKAHHEDPTKNFGPDFLDQLFGTNAGPEYEDSVQHIPYLVQACIITHFAKAYFQWKD